MSIYALALVFASAILHASWNLLAKQISGVGRASPAVWLFCGVTVVVYLPVAILLGAFAQMPLSNLQTCALGASAVLHLIYALVLQKGYAAGDLSVVYPIARGSGPLLSALGAVVFLGERPGAVTIGGVLLVAAGVLSLAGGRALLRRGAQAGVGWGLLTGIFVAAYTLVDAYSVAVLLIGPLLLDYLDNVLRLAFLTPSALRSWISVCDIWKKYRWRIVLIGVLSPLAYILFLLALKFSPVVSVAPAREVSLLIGALLGAHLLGEKNIRQRLLGACLIAIGVACLALG